MSDTPEPVDLRFLSFDRSVDRGERQEYLRLIEREERSALGELDSSGDDVDSLLDGPDMVPAAGGTARVGGSLVGLLFIELLPESKDIFFDVHIDPDQPAAVRRRVRQELMDRARNHALAIARPDPGRDAGGAAAGWDADPTVWQLLSGAYTPEEEANEALTAAGFRPVRTFLRMRIETPAGYPAPANPPPGVTTRAVRDESDRRLVHSLYTQAFADHWAEVPRDYEDWLATQRGRPGHDEQRWWLAELHGRPAAVCLLSDARLPLGYGYVDVLGVTAEARGVGIAKYLLRRAFADSAGRGLRGTELSVDAASPTGADRLYRSVGMWPYRSIRVWLTPLIYPK